jgi:hypothetical protein
LASVESKAGQVAGRKMCTWCRLFLTMFLFSEGESEGEVSCTSMTETSRGMLKLCSGLKRIVAAADP